MFRVAELSGDRALTAVMFSVLQVPPPPGLWAVLLFQTQIGVAGSEVYWWVE